MDIMFAMDGSTSVGSSNYEIQKTWLRSLITSTSNTSRVAIDVFSNNSSLILDMDYYSQSFIETFVSNISYPSGYTNTMDTLQTAIDNFNSAWYDTNRINIMVLITDGRPCISGCCYCSACYQKIPLQNAGIFMDYLKIVIHNSEIKKWTI